MESDYYLLAFENKNIINNILFVYYANRLSECENIDFMNVIAKQRIKLLTRKYLKSEVRIMKHN